MAKEWTEPQEVTASKDNLPDTPGLYRLRLYKNGEPVTIGRLCGGDSEGILYIGRADSGGLRKRLGGLLDALQRKGQAHKVAQRYLGNRAVMRLHGDHTVMFEYKTFPRFDQAQKALGVSFDKVIEAYGVRVNEEEMADAFAIAEERSELRRYEHTFGELPPLNRRAGDKVEGEEITDSGE